MKVLVKTIFLVFTFALVFLLFNISTNAQTVLVNYDFASTTAATPCVYGGPLTTAAGVTSSYTTSTGNCTTPAGTASTVPPAFVANSSNQSVSITGFATGSTQFFTFQINNVTNFIDYMVFFQAQRSASGPTDATLQYSTDGIFFTNFQAVTVPTSFSTGFNFDLSAVSAIENQTTVYFRIFAAGGTSATGTFRIDNFQTQATLLLAASAQVGGRVMDANGNGIGKVLVKISGGELSQPIYAITNPFGYYNFEVPSGQTYFVTVSSKSHTFSNPTRVINVNDNITDLNFTAEER
ncbi:hypothetical protein BH20ACI4_BH20ACI4_06290 [soil metagenome]